MKLPSWLNSIVVVSALGYFVDIFDLFTFSVVRIQSLKSLGVTDDAILSEGIRLLNFQMSGILIGAVFWGTLGDRKGRLTSLFGSILLYSIANLGNAFVTDLNMYAALRFISGFGLAGELGVAITLVSEILPKHQRGLGTMFVASLGLSGSIFAGLLSQHIDWRTSYLVGGGLGLLLLFLRFQTRESPLYQNLNAQKQVRRGRFLDLFSNRERGMRYLKTIAVGFPIWGIFGIVVTFSPEFAKALQIHGPVSAAICIQFSNLGVVIGDVLAGWMSHVMRSRTRVLKIFLFLLAATAVVFLNFKDQSVQAFYGLCFFMGFSTGYWTIFITVAAESFGTNLRSTVATTAPNFVRGSVVPLTLFFQTLLPSLGMIPSATVLIVIVLAIGSWSIWSLQETFARDLEFTEA
ncbi:MAG: MFS transporter [Bdellovibrionales bacterium]|nr:MFS transporter [Bdellovibrionales bacterium]